MLFPCDAETYRGVESLAQPSFTYPTQWPSFVKDTKMLYLKHEYNRCASQCEKMLQNQSKSLQPLHVTFLHFFIAICNESLGLAAHRFSPKKLVFLHRAKNAFTAALASLPLPHASDHPGDYERFMGTAHPPVKGQVDGQDHPESSTVERSERDVSRRSPPASDRKRHPDERRDSGYDSRPASSPACTDTTPDFNSYSAHQPVTALLSHIQSGIQTSPRPEDAEQGGSLLSNNHDLMPKPLAVKKRTADVDTLSTAPPLHQPFPIHPVSPTHRRPAILPTHPNNNNNNNNHLSSCSSCSCSCSFHHQLRKHLGSIDQTIRTVARLQHEQRPSHHHPRKPAASSLCSSHEPAADMAVTTEEQRQRQRQRRQDDTDTDTDTARQARMETLRRSGWRVDKERHGWKGSAYYERLRDDALADLALDGRRIREGAEAEPIP